MTISTRLAVDSTRYSSPELLQLLTPEFLKSTRFARYQNVGKMLTLPDLPWFNNTHPLYLAPMAKGLRTLFYVGFGKEQGADVSSSELVSADGILQRNQHHARDAEL